MLPRKRVLPSMIHSNSSLQVDRLLMAVRGASQGTSRICVQLVLILLVLLTATIPSQAQGGCPSCKKSKPFVTIGFYAKACARYPYLILIENGIVAQGSGVCTTTGWTSTERILVDLKPNVPYTFSVDAGETCSSHFNFYDIPEGYKLEIDGVETTTIDKVSSRGYGGNGDWTVVVREECDPCGSGPSGTPSGPDVGSVLWGVGLGNLSDGRSAGSLAIREKQLTATSYTPDALVYTPPGHTDEVDVTQNVNGNHRQIKVPESLADILVMSATEYEIRFYKAADVGSKDGSGLYSLTGSPYVTYTITNPNPATTTSLRISKSENGGPADVSEYTWDPVIDSWTLSRSNGARIETKVVSYPTETSRTETFTVREGAQVISRVATTYYTYSFGEELVQEVVDPDGAALTTAYTYYEDPGEIRWHKIKSITYPDGSWIKYDYDNNGNRSLVLRPWKDLTLASATEQNARATLYTYSNTDGITTSVTPRFVSTVTEKIAGIVVGSTTYNRLGTTINGNPAVVETKRIYSSANVSYATTTTTYHSTAVASLAERVASIEYPDGKKDTYTYEKGNYIPNADPSLSQFVVDVNGQAERETVTNGTVTSPNGIAFKTLKKTTVRDQKGNQVLAETYVYNGTAHERMGWTANIYDGRGHIAQTIQHNGQISSAVWTGDRQSSGIDASGVESTYTYDALGRIRTTVKKGIAAGGGFSAQADITITTVYNAEGNLTSQTVSGGAPTLGRSLTYDVAGRMKTATDEAGLITSYSYANGGRTKTIIRPGGATETADRYLDGTVKSVTGSAVVATYFDYDVNPDGTQYSKTYTGAAGLSSPRWTKTTTDWMHRGITVEKPSFTGTNVIQSSIYNALGQLQKQVTMAGSTKLIADTLFEYDELGQQKRMGLDINGDGAFTLASTDRLAEQELIFEKAGTDWFLANYTRTFLTDNDGTATTQVDRVRLNNFAVNGTQHTVSDVTVTDVAGNSARVTTVIDRAAKKKIVTTDAADSNIDAVNVTVNGLLQSSVPTTPQLATTFAYDAFGRQTTMTDPRIGTETRAYSSTSGQITSLDDGNGTTSYQYYDREHSNAGLLKTQIDPVNKKTNFNYNGRGEMVQIWGDAAYPKEFVYDSYGQRTELHTFRAGQNWSGTAWPTGLTGSADVTKWIYQESTGLLLQKQDHTLKGATYTYDELGRIKTRQWARGITATYNYDANTGELTSITYSDTTPAVSFTYDRGGRSKNITDASGSRVRTFNVRGELQTENITTGILDGVGITVGYDSFLRRDSLQTSHSTNTLNSQTYGYDTSSRLQTVTSGGRTATYAYYANSGLLNTTTFTGGTTIGRSYDGTGRLQSITTTPAADVAQSYAYTYNPLSQRTQVTREDGSYWSYVYNDRRELVSAKKSWSDGSKVWGAQTEYSFDNVGNRVYAKNGGNQLGSLRQSNYTAGSRNEYVQRSVPGAVDLTGTANTAATVSVNNQPAVRKNDYFYRELAVDNTSGPAYQQINIVGARNNFGAGGEDAVTQKGGNVLLPASVESFNYDDDGNLISDGRWNYTWDAENRLISMESIAAVPPQAKKRLEFSYDCMSRRIQKKVFTWNSGAGAYQLQSTSKFIYDGRQLVVEMDGNNNVLRQTIWGGVEILLISAGGNTFLPGYDGNENVGSLIDANTGTIAALYEYDSFGRVLKAVGQHAGANPFRFSSQYTDLETGLNYYGHRFYDPEIGRWLSRDPAQEDGGLNLYGFVDNDGVNHVDYLGLWTRDTWTGGWYDYKGNATAEKCDGLAELARLITGDENDWKKLNHPEEVREGEVIDITPLLEMMETKVRTGVRRAASAFNPEGWPTYNPTTGEFVHPPTYWLVTGASQAEAISRYFQKNQKYGRVGCDDAATLILSQGLISVIGASMYDQVVAKLGNDPLAIFKERWGKVGTMLEGDSGWLPNYDDYQGLPSPQDYGHENSIKIARDLYFGHPIGRYNLRRLERILQDQYEKAGGSKRRDPIPGLHNKENVKITFVDIAKVFGVVFDIRKAER